MKEAIDHHVFEPQIWKMISVCKWQFCQIYYGEWNDFLE